MKTRILDASELSERIDTQELWDRNYITMDGGYAVLAADAPTWLEMPHGLGVWNVRDGFYAVSVARDFLDYPVAGPFATRKEADED